MPVEFLTDDLVPLLEFNQSTISLKKAGLVYDLPAIDTYAKYRANVTPAPVSIVDRGTFCLMDLSRVGYVQIREFAQPNTHVLYLIHQTLSLEENIYEILFQAQNPGLFH